jgi:NADH dehydrogenase FAD-containing subunit
MIGVMTRVLLAGGGHTHLLALPRIASGAGGARVALLAPSPRLLYSGMMPGWLSGRHAFDDCSIDLERVARAAGIEWIEDALADVDFRSREAIGASGRRHRYDLLSLNVGSENPTGERAPGSTVHVLGAKPFAAFVDGWRAWCAEPRESSHRVVVGGGAAAVEIAFALAAPRADRRPAGPVTLATTGRALLPGLSRIAARIALRSLAARGVEVLFGLRYVGVEADRVVLAPEAGGEPRHLPADLVVVATGARPPAWLTAAVRAGGLPVAADGGVAVDDCLRSTGDDAVFASGDCATFVHARVPKSGVHALRQGAPLAESVLRRLLGAPGACAAPARYRPQRRALALLDRADGSAIAAWGPLGAAGGAMGRWKDRIDRGFVARFR